MPLLAHVALVVRDYDEALAFCVGKLGFELVEDTRVPAQGKRWVTIRPPGAPANATNILLARAATPDQAARIGDQTGGRVAFFLHTDNLAAARSGLAQANPHTREAGQRRERAV